MATNEQPVQEGRTISQADPVAGRVVPVGVMKGGVGKSIISQNLADRIAARGYDTLYMDLDPNGHATDALRFGDIYYSGTQDLSDVVCPNPTKSPGDMIYRTDFGFDFTPAGEELEFLDDRISNSPHPTKRLRQGFFKPLLANGEYDFIVVDMSGKRGTIEDNVFYAAQQTIIPVEPGRESVTALQKTKARVIDELREFQPFEVRAIVPNKLSQRLDHNNQDRRLLEYLHEEWESALPPFAQVGSFEEIDTGRSLPKPGLRKDADLGKVAEEGAPVSEFAPESTAVDHFDQLADTVINGVETQ